MIDFMTKAETGWKNNCLLIVLVYSHFGSLGINKVTTSNDLKVMHSHKNNANNLTRTKLKEFYIAYTCLVLSKIVMLSRLNHN
jgi:hypothetical protein